MSTALQEKAFLANLLGATDDHDVDLSLLNQRRRRKEVLQYNHYQAGQTLSKDISSRTHNLASVIFVQKLLRARLARKDVQAKILWDRARRLRNNPLQKLSEELNQEIINFASVAGRPERPYHPIICTLDAGTTKYSVLFLQVGGGA